MPSSIIQVDSPADGRTPTSRPRFTLKQIHFICWSLFVAFLAIPLALELKSETQKGRLLQQENDFVQFYAMGRALNEHPPSQLYDYEQQQKVEAEVLHLKNGRQFLPFPYPPFVALLFRPVARLPFRFAYPLWLSITFLLYIGGLTMAAGSFFPNDPLRRSLIFCGAFSFLPFWWIVMQGQLPIIGFIAIALAFREENRERPLLSGLALSLCLYKPTLLVLILPMLLVTRRYRTLMGFVSGGLALGALTTAVEGAAVWSGYLRLLLGVAAAAGEKHKYVLHYYMDLRAFSSLLPGGRSWLGLTVLLGCAGWAAFRLFQAWWTHRDAGKSARFLLWAATLTWTFVLNIYVPIYDSIIPIIGVIATAAVLQGFPDQRLRRQFTVLWILILFTSWFTGPVAEATGFQMYTVLFALLGTVQLIALYKIGAAQAPGKPGALLLLPGTSALAE